MNVIAHYIRIRHSIIISRRVDTASDTVLHKKYRVVKLDPRKKGKEIIIGEKFAVKLSRG